MDHDRGIDKVRSLVMDYVVCHVEIIVEHAMFRETLQERGALAKSRIWDGALDRRLTRGPRLKVT